MSEFVLSVRELHNTLSTPFVVEHFLLAFVEDCFWKDARAGRKVVSVSSIGILVLGVSKAMSEVF